MEKINILFLLLSLNVGGTERHIFDLVSNLDRKRYNIVICCLYDLGAIGTNLVNTKTDVKIYHNLIKHKWDVFGILKLMRIISNEKIHILYTINTALPQFLGTIAAMLFRVDACVTRVTATKPTYHPDRRMFVNKIMLPFMNKIIAQADAHKKYLMEYEKIKREKIEVIYNGVEFEKFNIQTNKIELKENLRIDAGYFVVGIVARLVPEKGYFIFLKAAKKVLGSFPNVCFLIIGDGREKEKLKNFARELGIESKVFFLGLRRDIPQLLSVLDVTVLSSMNETSSNAVLEYMAAGKPVVATDAGSAMDVIVDGETGFLISDSDPDAMADAILKLLQDRNLAKKMGAAGRERIKEKFTISNMIANYESLFLDLMKGN